MHTPAVNSSLADIPAQDFWEARYQAGQTPWDLGEAAPPFVSALNHPALNTPALSGKPGRMAVVGSGPGHDAALFARAGWAVTGLDLSAAAVAQAMARYGEVARFVEADLFNLPTDLTAQFDVVLEHTCFCAILPEQRAEYVQAVARLLKPGGSLLGLFWAHNEPGGPPFGTSEAEIRGVFEPTFAVRSVEVPGNSVASRKGEERLCWFQLKN